MAEISINSSSDIQELILLYEKNKNRPWNEWLDFKTTFAKPGKQGLVGILTSKESDSKDKKQE